MIVEHREVKEEIYEDYNGVLQDAETQQEEHIEYIHHADGAVTEKRTVKNTHYDFGGASSDHPTQASHGFNS